MNRQIHRIKTAPVSQQKIAHTAAVVPQGNANIFNLGLAALALSLLLCYVVQTNRLASQTWQVKQAQEQLSSILEQRNSLVAQQSQLDDRNVLQNLAVNDGFVPAGNVVYLVQDTSVATAR